MYRWVAAKLMYVLLNNAADTQVSRWSPELWS